MNDIAKCADDKCPSKDFCYRFTAPESVFGQAYGQFEREEDAYNCDMFWDNGICKYCHQKNSHKATCITQKNYL